MEKSADRLRIIEKIKQFEAEEKWDIDVEDDPPTIPLEPNMVDYLDKKLINKIINKFANRQAEKFYDNLLKEKKLIIKEVKGIENFSSVKGGAIVTCNHFNPFDIFAIQVIFREVYGRKRKLYKIIREGNYTNFPGFYGFLFRHCNTLPLSSNYETMKKFLHAVSVLLKRGEKIVIYPEQAMWWNYKKPRPLQDGAFNFACTNKVPIIPLFITMEDSDIVGEDGFFIQEYTMHFLPPIYADENLSKRENIKAMKEQNYNMWKQVYEETYKKPLTYKE